MAMRNRMTGLIGASILVVALAGCGGSPTKESTGEYIDDSVLTTKVKTALLHDPQVKGTSVKVETFKGKVQLSGFVSTEEERARAAELARDVKGVEQVQNDLQLRR